MYAYDPTVNSDPPILKSQPLTTHTLPPHNPKVASQFLYARLPELLPALSSAACKTREARLPSPTSRPTSGPHARGITWAVVRDPTLTAISAYLEISRRKPGREGLGSDRGTRKHTATTARFRDMECGNCTTSTTRPGTTTSTTAAGTTQLCSQQPPHAVTESVAGGEGYAVGTVVTAKRRVHVVTPNERLHAFLGESRRAELR